jgi:hypothetical protein
MPENRNSLQHVGFFFVSTFNLQLSSGGPSGICLWHMSAEAKLLWPLLGPVLLYFGLLLCVAISWKQCQCCPAHSGSKPTQIVKTAWILGLTSFVSITKAAFNLVQCKYLSLETEQLKLIRIGDVECFSTWFQYLALILLIPMCCAFPVLVFYVGRGSRYRSAAALLTHAFATHAPWFEAVLSAERLMLILCATFIFNPLTRAFVLLLWLALFLALHLYLRPFSVEQGNKTGTLMHCLLLLMATTQVSDATTTHLAAKQSTQTTIVAVLQTVCLIVPVCFIAIYMGTICASRLKRLYTGSQGVEEVDLSTNTAKSDELVLSTPSDIVESKSSDYVLLSEQAESKRGNYNNHRDQP